MSDLVHKVGAFVAAIVIVLMFTVGTGPVIMGSLTGMGLFFAMLMVGMARPSILAKAAKHPILTEVGTTAFAFWATSMFGSTATGGIASIVVCLFTTATLGFSKLAWLKKFINWVVYKVIRAVPEPRGDKEDPETLKWVRETVKKRAPKGPDPVDVAIANAVREISLDSAG